MSTETINRKLERLNYVNRCFYINGIKIKDLEPLNHPIIIVMDNDQKLIAMDNNKKLEDIIIKNAPKNALSYCVGSKVDESKLHFYAEANFKIYAVQYYKKK